jgi:hypothetical protein
VDARAANGDLVPARIDFIVLRVFVSWSLAASAWLSASSFLPSRCSLPALNCLSRSNGPTLFQKVPKSLGGQRGREIAIWKSGWHKKWPEKALIISVIRSKLQIIQTPP